MTEETFFLEPGYIFVSEQPYRIQTVLGSCISVCIWDSMRKAGGMNHFIYGRARQGVFSARYGDVSTSHLIRLMTDMGCHCIHMRAHIVGGGQNPELSAEIGDENIKVAEEILRKSGIQVVTKDVGGQTGRKVIFNNLTGEILVYKGIEVRKNDWYTAGEE